EDPCVAEEGPPPAPEVPDSCAGEPAMEASQPDWDPKRAAPSARRNRRWGVMGCSRIASGALRFRDDARLVGQLELLSRAAHREFAPETTAQFTMISTHFPLLQTSSKIARHRTTVFRCHAQLIDRTRFEHAGWWRIAVIAKMRLFALARGRRALVDRPPPHPFEVEDEDGVQHRDEEKCD